MRTTITFFLVVACSGCGLPTDDPGTDALIQVPSATFFRKAPPKAGTGPAVTNAQFIRSLVIPGTPAGLSGLVPDTTGGIVIAAQGDVGYWVIEPGIEDGTVPNVLDFSTSVILAEDAVDPAMIGISAVDVNGNVGPATILTLGPEPRPVPTGKVVVSLDWDVEADLDLRVRDPNGVLIWHDKINSYTPPSTGTVDPTAYLDGGILDFDSNALCVIDGLRQENVVWATTAPEGNYSVLIDTFSLCATTAARWHIRTFVDNNLVMEVRGESLPTDTRFDHGPNGGLFIGDFNVTD